MYAIRSYYGVEALFRRSLTRERVAFGRMKIDTAGRDVLVDGIPVIMSRKEYDLLVYLAENENISLSSYNFV